MTTLDTATVRPGRRHKHASAGEARCPLCGQPISAVVEQALKDQLARDKTDAEARANAAIEKARKEATKTAEQRIKAAQANLEAVIAQRLRAQRETLNKEKDAALNAERQTMFSEKLKLEQQLQEMQRRLQRKTAHELGEPAEVDLFEALRGAFPDDRISRITKGRRGADVLLEVVHGGAIVGSIILDSKNCAKWSNAFSKKLRADQLASAADFSILSTNVLPAGAQQLHLADGVLAARPALVPALVALLRRQVVELHRLKLAGEGRNAKAEALLTYLVSPACADRLDRIVKLTGEMTDLDRTEAAAHQRTWSKRADLISGIRAAHDEFAAGVGRIMEGTP